MKKSTVGLRGSSSSNFHAERWTLIVPRIIREYMEKGFRYYDTEDGKKYLADVYDTKLVPPKSKAIAPSLVNKTTRERK